MERKKGILVLASGKTFNGWIFGVENPKESSAGEVVFNTSLTGYQEILTDPSYQGQIVVMTPSHIGNTGINKEDIESRKIFLSGFVVQELSGLVSNWRSQDDLHNTFVKAGISGLTGVDTRALTRHLRTQGAINGIISSDTSDIPALVKKAKALPSLEGQDLVSKVTTKSPYDWTKGSGNWNSWPDQSSTQQSIQATGRKKKVVVMDFGVKQNILRCLIDLNCEVKVVPATTTASDILNHKPDGVLLSNGPGDPAMVRYGIDTIKDLMSINQEKESKGEKPFSVFGICLGHQLLGLALGGKTYKLKFGHHGSNHPIKELGTEQVDITSQNHGFCIEGEQKSKDNWELKGNKDVKVTHINLNDNAIEGLSHKKLPAFSVQYHPEASAGPHDSRHLFKRFMKSMDKN